MPFDSRVHCHISSTPQKYNGSLRDISILGLFMECENIPAPGSRCELDIVVESQHSRLKIEDIHGKIIRTDTGGFAIRFDERLEWIAMVTLCSHKQREQAV